MQKILLSLFLVSGLVAAPAAKVKPPTNKKCPVMGGAVTEKSATAEVRGQQYRVCCPGCIEMLKKDPDKYLNKDGSPKNAK